MLNTDDKKPLNYILSLLARKEYSYYELFVKLLARDISHQKATELLNLCVERGWQSDIRLTEQTIKSYSERLYGPLYIKRILAQKRIPDTVIEESFHKIDIDWVSLGCNLLQKKYTTFDLKTKQSAYRLLSYRGYYGDDLGEILRKFRFLMNS